MDNKYLEPEKPKPVFYREYTLALIVWALIGFQFPAMIRLDKNLAKFSSWEVGAIGFAISVAVWTVIVAIYLIAGPISMKHPTARKRLGYWALAFLAMEVIGSFVYLS